MAEWRREWRWWYEFLLVKEGEGWVFSPPSSVGRVPSGEPLCSRCPTPVYCPLSDTLSYVSHMFRCVSYGRSIYVFYQFSFLFMFRFFLHISTIVCVLSFFSRLSSFLFLPSFPHILYFHVYVKPKKTLLNYWHRICPQNLQVIGLLPG